MKTTWIRSSFKLLSLSFALALTSCGEEVADAKVLKHSPEFNMISGIDNLAIVYTVDIVNIIEKTAFDKNADMPAIVKMGWATQVQPKLKPENSGVILAGNNPIAMSMGEDGEPAYIMTTLKVVDASKVGSMLDELGVLNANIKSTGSGDDILYTVEDDEVALVWDSENLVGVYSTKESSMKIAKELLDIRYVDGADNEGLEGYLNQEDDWNVYYDFKTLQKFTSHKNYTGGELSEEMLAKMEGAYTITKGNFEAGEIKFEVDVHAPQMIESEYNVLSQKTISEEFLNYLTPDKLLSFGTLSLNMDNLFTVIEMSSQEEYTDENVKRETGLSKKEIESIFSGEFAFSLIDVIQEKVVINASDDDFFEEEFTYQTEKPSVVVTLGLNDSTMLGALLRSNEDKFEYHNGYYKLDDEAFLVLTENKAIITIDTTMAAFFKSGDRFALYKIKNGKQIKTPMYGFVNTDVDNYPEGVLKLINDSGVEAQKIKDFIRLFDDVSFEGDFVHSEFVVKMKNKQDNALKVIMDFLVNEFKDEPFF